jgi:hypothetical protein
VPGCGARLPVAIAAVIVFGTPCVLFYRLILFHFYVRGGFLYDTGLLAALAWHSPPTLPLPSSLGPGPGFFAYHVAPIFLLLSAISDLLPATMPQMFAGFVGVCHGLLALAPLWLLVEGYGMRRGRALALAALASAAFAFNGLAIAIARYPHFETFGAACLLLALVALALRHHVPAAVAFAFALATREDFGLHAFGFLILWVAIDRLRRVPWREDIPLVGFAAAGLIWSATALALQHQAFPDASSFVRVYVGDPPFAHIRLDMVTTRLGGWLLLHSCMLFPAAFALFLAARTRNPYVMAGYLACLPWAALQLLAVSDLAGWMVGYYAFPFLIAMAWPWIAGLIRGRQGAALPPANQAAAALLVTVALSLLPFGRDYDPGRITLPEAFLHPPSAAQQALTERAMSAIVAAKPALGPLVVDNSTATLRPRGFVRAEIGGWDSGSAATVVYFADGYDAARLQGRDRLPQHYAVPGTEIRIETDRPEATMQALGIPLAPAP